MKKFLSLLLCLCILMAPVVSASAYTDANVAIGTETYPDAEAILMQDGAVIGHGLFSDMWAQAVQKNNCVVRLNQNIMANVSTGFGSGDAFFCGGLLIPADKHVGLDLNGYTLNRNVVGGSNKRIISLLSDSAVLDIFDGKNDSAGGIISGCDTDGSAIYVDGIVNMYGGSIRENNVGQATVFVGKTGYFNMLGQTGHAELVANQCKAGAKTAGIYVEGVLGIAGDVLIQNNGSSQNVLIGCDSSNAFGRMVVMGVLADTAHICLSSESGSSVVGWSSADYTLAEGDESRFASDDAERDFSIAGDNLIWHRRNAEPEAQLTVDDEWTVTGSFAGMWNLAASIGKGKITMLEDVTAKFTNDTDLCSTFGNGVGFDGNGRLVVENSASIVLDLNGHTIDKAMGSKAQGEVSGELFYVKPESSLVIMDPTNSGVIKGAFGLDAGAVHVCENGIFEFQGGIISNNRSMTGVGGVKADGHVYISGGRIVDNDRGVEAGAVGTVILSNEARIYNNTHDGKADNLKVMDGSVVKVIAPLSSVANIGVNLEKEDMTVVAVKDDSSANNLTDSDAAVFTVDNSRKVVRVDGDSLVLGQPAQDAQASYTNSEGALVKTGSFVDCMNEAVANGGTVRLLEDIDVDLTKWFEISGRDVTLALNGKHAYITKTQYEIFNVVNGGSLTIRDTGMVKSTRTVVDFIDVSADGLAAKFKVWQTNNAIWDDANRVLTYYAIEENAGKYELVKYVADYTEVGCLHMETSNGSAVNVNASEFAVRGGMFSGSAASDKFCSVSNSGTVVVNGGTFFGFSSGVVASTSSKIDVRDGLFVGNTASCLTLSGTSTGTLLGGRFLGNSAANGAVLNISGSSTVSVGSNTIMSLNKASNNGGAIYQNGSSSLKMDGIKFKGSQGANSGAVYSSSNVDMKNCKFVGCYTTNNSGSVGGGAFVTKGSVEDCQFVQCEAQHGGGLYVNNNADVIDVVIQNCKALSEGGGLYLSNSMSVVSNCDISGCVANTGGGVIVRNNSQIELSGVITNCSASSVGGGIVIGTNVKGATIEVDVFGCSANTGGGISVENDVSETFIVNSKFDDNVASLRAGGIYVNGSGSKNLRIVDTEVKGNKVSVDGELKGEGGGIYVKSGSVAMAGGLVDSNEAYCGGGIFVEANNQAFMNVIISNNIASNNGGGVAVNNGVTDLTSCNVRANQVTMAHSLVEDVGGAGVSVHSGATVNITQTNVTNNVTQGNGGGILQVEGIVRLANSLVGYNEATNGGGIYCSRVNKEVLSVVDTRVINNKASDRAGGINTREGMTLAVGGNVRVIDNKSFYSDDDLYLRSGVVAQIIKRLTNTSSIGITPQNAPTAFASIPVLSGIDAENSLDRFYHNNIVWEKRYNEKTSIAEFVNDSALGELTQDDNTEFNGILVQYYANQAMPSRSPANADDFPFDIIDTSGKVLPHNDDSHRETYSAYIDKSTGKVVMQNQLSRIFKARIFDYDSHLQAEVLNRFLKEDGWAWVANEIWILKDGKLQTSLNRSDWDVVTWEPGKTLGELGISDGDCIRIVSESVSSAIDVDTTFYDYDIMNGYYYTTESDAKNDRNRKEISTWDGKSCVWTRTGSYGINSDNNYTDVATNSRLTFGNVNTGVAHRGDQLGAYELTNSSGKYCPVNPFINGANNLSNNYRTCVFDLVKGLDENNHIIYNDNIAVPKLFNDGDAIGKTVIDECSLQFSRVGDTYTLTKVSNGGKDVLTDLNTFNHPVYGTKTHTNLMTNNFWPMDELGVAGTDGHDLKTGSKALTDSGNTRFVGDTLTTYYNKDGAVSGGNTGAFAASDDGELHNNYFGMHFGLKFSTESDYTAPLGYYFFGDDDMWVFLDGELICDIGGVHSSAGSYTNLRDYIPEGDVGEHELQFFYTERGASGSTCWMQFNLPHNVKAAVDDKFMFLKTNQDGKPLGNAVFGMYRDADCQDLLQTVVSDDTGYVNVTDLETTRVYYLKEISAPEDYLVDDKTYVVTFGSGAWSMYELGDTNKVNKDSLMNQYQPKPFEEMPETGGSGVVWMYVAGCSILVIAGVWFILSRHKRKK